MNNEISNEDLLSNVRARLGVDKGGLKYPTYVAPPSFKPGTDELDDKSALTRRARFIASGEMLFKTDLSTLDDTGASALYEVVTEGMFGLKDSDGQMAFGKRAKKNPRENLEMLRRFVKGEYNLIEDPEYTKWREMDEEGKFQYALENETTSNKLKSHIKGERGASLAEQANAVASVGPKVMGPDAIIADFFTPKKEKERKEHVFQEAARRSNYDMLNDEEKAAYRADVIGDYEKKLSRRQTLATYLQFASNLSDKAAYLLAASFQKGTPDINVEFLDPEERDKVYSAFSLMRGDKKRGHLLGFIEQDFEDGTAFGNRFQMALYGLQQSFVGLVTDAAEFGRDAAMLAYAKASMDEAERKAFFDGWDANVRAEQAMEQPLPEAEGWLGAGVQGLAENVHWFIPYGAIGKGGKMAAAAGKTVARAGLMKEAVMGMRTASELKAAAAKTRWLADVQSAVKAGKGAKKVSQFQSAVAMKRELAAIENYTKALAQIADVEKTAKAGRIGGRALWTIGEASAFSAFASEYVAAADAAGVSREESMITAWAIGLVNARIERLYVAGLESSLTPAQIKALTFKALYNAVKSDGSAGFRKWFVNRVQRGVVEGAKVTATEGLVEEPLQQLAVEHGKEFDKLCQELRADGKTDFADKAAALWRSFAGQLPEDYGVFVDTVCDTLPTSLAFGATTVGNAVRKQHLHNAWTRHQNRRAGSTHTMFGATSPEELRTAIDYDAGLVDLIQQGINTQLAVEKHWKGDKSDEAKNPHRFAEALTAARRAYRNPQTRDVVQEVAEAAGVDVKTAEVITQYLQTEAESIAFSPQARAFSSLRMSLADIDETTIKTVLPGYIEGSYAADEENGIYSGRVKLGDGTERTIAYRIGDVSEMLREQVEENSKIDSSYGVSFDERQEELGTGITWASLSDAQRYRYALTLSNAFATRTHGVFELTDAKGEKVRVNADDVIYLANGRLGDIGYGPAATMGTARHETFHSLWRFARATLDEEDVQSLAKALGVDVTANGWENKLDERMAHQLEMYASGHYVSHAVSSRFDKMLDGWAGNVIKFFGSFGPADEVRDPKTGKSFALKDFYGKVLRGELGSGKLGVEIRNIPAAPAVQPGATDVKAGTMPVEVTDEERAAEEAETRKAATETEKPVLETEQPVSKTGFSVSGTSEGEIVYTAENPADASVPNARYYKIGLPNSDVKLVGRLEVRDAHTGLTTSTDEDYHDRGNQNRDDKSEESRALVMKIAGHPDPLQIGTVQPIANNGIVWILNNSNVIIGNHRVNGVRAGYEKGTAGDLEKFVREDAAKRGIEIGENVKKPLMVFGLERIESPEGQKAADVHEVVRLANESQNRGFNIREQAGNDAKILIDNNLLPRMAFRADGRIDETKCADAIGKFRLESGAQGLVGEDGMLTEEGQTRIQNAALAALLGGTGNAALMQRIMEKSGLLDMASQVRALMKITPDLMALADAKPDFDLRPAIGEALELFTEWRETDEEKRVEKGKSRHDWRERGKDGGRIRGLSWEAFMSQGDMFRKPSEEAQILGDLFARSEDLRSFDREDVESAAGKKRVVDLISGYLADYIANARAVNTETDDMFGGTPASRAEVLAAQRAKGESGARFSIVTPAEDAAYMEAVERGDMETARKLLKVAWERNGYSQSRDHLDAHAAPSAPVEAEDFKNVEALMEAREEGWDLNLWAVAKGISGQPNDFFSEQGPRLYGYDDKAGIETQKEIAKAISMIQAGINTRIYVYRAVPNAVKSDFLQSGGEWVSPSKTYVENHGKFRFGEGEYRIIERLVPAEHLWWDGNDAREWGYDDGRQYVYANTENGSKLATVTYNSDGNVIPLSQRFNPQNNDIRFSVSGELTGVMLEKVVQKKYGVGSAKLNGEGFVDLERGDTFKGIEKAVREKVHEQVENTNLGITATIGSNTNADHLVQKMSFFKDEDPEAHKYAVKNTLELFKKAKTAVVHHDKKGRKNDYVRAFAPFYFRDGIYLATITLRRDKDSDKFYAIEAVETERDAASGVSRGNDASKMDSGDSPRSSRRTAQEAQSPVSLEDKISYYVGDVNATDPKFLNSDEEFSLQKLAKRIRADISAFSTPMFSVAPGADARASGLFPALQSMSDDELVTAAAAVKMALGKSEKVSDKAVKISSLQKVMRRLHPEWGTAEVGRESLRVMSDARKFAKKIREDIDRGVSDSLILEHLPQTAREQFGREMVEEARKGQRLGRFGQKVASKLEDRQARIVEDAVRVQTGMDVSLMENLYGVNLSETLMHLAENPLTEKPPQSPSTDEGESVQAEESAGEETEPIDVSAAVQAAVNEIVGTAKTATDANERNRADRRAAAGRDAERAAELDGEDATGGGTGEDFGGEDIVAIATKKAGLDLENPRHLAEFVAELTRRYWIKEHELGQDAEVWRDLVAVQFLRKTAQGIYAKLCKDLTYSRSRETAMQHIARLDNVPTVQGLLSEMEFVGALINAQRIRDTQKAMCEKLDLFLRQKFGAQGRFRPDKEEGKRNVSAEAELRARYMRHAMWLTPDAAADEARELQEKLDLLAVEFSEAGRDRDQSREFIETFRKLNVLREFGALRYKPVGEIEAAAKWWWEDFERGESDDIVREMSDRDIRTKKAAELLAKAFADPKRVTVREGATTADRINKFLTGHMGFVALLNDCMRHATDADREAVKDIIGYIQREIQKAGDGTATEKRHHNDAFHAAVESIYAKSFNKVMKEMMAEDERFLKFMGEVGGKREIPTKGRAMQLLVSLLQEGRKIEVEDEENPGKTKFIYEGGYHDNIVRHKREGQAAELMKLMSPADMNMIKWLGMWYEQNRQDLSRVCHSLFGIGVYAELPNYFPVKMRLDKQGLEKGAAVGWTIFPKALTPRVKNERDFDTSADIFQMWSSRMEEGAQWKHHAQLGLEMRGIFGRAELQGAVISNHGEATNALMQGFITDVLAGKGAVDRSTGDVQYISDKIRGWTALCALGGNVGVMLKQTTSIPAFGFEIGLVDTARHIVSAFTPEGLAAMGKIWQSEQRKTRWDVGNSEAVANALNKQDASWLKRAFQASMITNKLGDVVPALVVGQGVYRDCIARGMSEADAMAETWMLVERTQQSSRMENLASVQRRNRVGRIMFQFLSTQRQYLDYELRAIREVIAQPSSVNRWKKLGTTILLNHFILTSAYYWMGQLYKAMLGQEPPEDELTDWVITCLLGPYGSLFVAGFCCNYTLQRALKGYSYGGGSSMLPMESWLKNQVNDGAKLVEAIFDSEGDTWDNMLDAAGKWMSDSNSLFRDLRKIYRFRIKGEEQKKRK